MDNIRYLKLPENEALGRTDLNRDPYALSRGAQQEVGIFDHLLPIVGDVETLDALDSKPLPDEPFDWSSVEPVDRSFVAEVLARSDECCEDLLDVEYRTIARRILARVARRDPRVLRRTTKADRVAAGLVYLVGRANGEFGRRGYRTAHSLWSWWGVSSCADRAQTLRRAAGLEPDGANWYTDWHDELLLGDATLLHSRYREQICRRRDYAVEYAPKPKFTWLPDGRHAAVRAAPAKAVIAGKGTSGTRLYVMIGLGDSVEDADYFALSIPDARELVRRVQNALDAPAPRPDNSP